jgi:hypothetical protein
VTSPACATSSLTHYFATNPEIIQLTIDKRLAPLTDAVERLKGLLPPEV